MANTEKHNHGVQLIQCKLQFIIYIIHTYIYTTPRVVATAMHLNPLTHSAIVFTTSAVAFKSLGGIVLLPPSSDGSKAAFKLSDIFWITIL